MERYSDLVGSILLPLPKRVIHDVNRWTLRTTAKYVLRVYGYDTPEDIPSSFVTDLLIMKKH